MTEATSEIRERYSALSTEVADHLFRYHVLDAPIITDGEFDELWRELLGIEEAHPELVTRIRPRRRSAAASPPSSSRTTTSSA